MSTYFSLGNVFQIRKVLADDQDLFNQCNNMRGLSESELTQQFNQYQAVYDVDDPFSSEEVQHRSIWGNVHFTGPKEIAFGGFISEKSDGVDVAFSVFKYAKITENNMSYYECNDDELGKYVAKEIIYGIPISLRGQQLGRILLPFINYWSCKTIPNLLNIVICRKEWTIQDNPNAPGILKFNAQTKSNGRTYEELKSAGKLWQKTEPPPNISVDRTFSLAQFQKVEDSDFRFNWEEVSKNADGKFYMSSDPEFSLSDWLMLNIYDNNPPSSRSQEQVRDAIRQKFV